MTFERTQDLDLVRRIMTHPRLWRWLGDDDSPAIDGWQPIEDERVWYVVVRDGAEVLGLLVFCRQSRVLWDVHCCLLPSSWGARSRRAAAEGFRWLFSRTEASRIAAAVPSDNRLALRLARDAGMSECGRHPRAFLRGGVLRDLVLFGMNREDVCLPL